MNPSAVGGVRRPEAAARRVLLVVLLALAAAVPGLAQEGGEEQSLGDLETRETASMREATYKELARAQEAAEAENYPLAVQTLEKLAKQELNNYERCQLLNLSAYVYYAQNQVGKAIAAYEQLLAQPELPEALKTSTLYTLSQLYFAREEWQKSIGMLERWIEATNQPSIQAYEMMAQAYYQQEKYREALRPAWKVIELTQQAGEQPRENSFLLLRVLHYEMKEYKQTIDVLQELIARYPKRQYWIQLAGLYGELEDQKRQLNTLELAYLQGYLTSEAEILSLVSLLLNNDVSYRAGKILDKALADGTVTPTLEHWRLLSQAWTMAQENERAVAPLTRAAELSSDGKMDVILAQTYMNLERWEEAVAAARTALRKGGIPRPDQVQVMLGQAYFEMARFDDAREAFGQAQSDRRSRQLAAQWISYIDSEEDRRSQLAAALE